MLEYPLAILPPPHKIALFPRPAAFLCTQRLMVKNKIKAPLPSIPTHEARLPGSLHRILSGSEKTCVAQYDNGWRDRRYLQRFRDSDK